jgi:hypothetical protein
LLDLPVAFLLYSQVWLPASGTLKGVSLFKEENSPAALRAGELFDEDVTAGELHLDKAMALMAKRWQETDARVQLANAPADMLYSVAAGIAFKGGQFAQIILQLGYRCSNPDRVYPTG